MQKFREALDAFPPLARGTEKIVVCPMPHLAASVHSRSLEM
jgi:hypothetical protein